MLKKQPVSFILYPVLPMIALAACSPQSDPAKHSNNPAKDSVYAPVIVYVENQQIEWLSDYPKPTQVYNSQPQFPLSHNADNLKQ